MKICKWKWCDANLVLGRFIWKYWAGTGRNQTRSIWLRVLTVAQMASASAEAALRTLRARGLGERFREGTQ